MRCDSFPRCEKSLKWLSSLHHVGKNAAGQVCKRVNVDLSGVEHDKEAVVTWVDLEPVTRAQCAIVTGPPSSFPPMSLHVTINVGSSSDLCNVYVCGFGGFLFHPGVNAIPWPDLLSQPDVPPPPLPPLIKGQVGRPRFGIDILQLFPHHYSTPARPASWLQLNFVFMERRRENRPGFRKEPQ